MRPDFLAMAVRDVRQTFTPTPIESRDCDQCHARKRTWLLETEIRADRVIKTFVCGSGHLTIVQEKV